MELDIIKAIATFTAKPTVSVNTGAIVDEAESIVIDNAKLASTDSDDDDNTLIYTVTQFPVNGDLRKSGIPNTSNLTFTQTELNQGIIDYLHDGSETLSDSFKFTVRDDGSNTTDETTFSITVNPVEDVASKEVLFDDFDACSNGPTVDGVNNWSIASSDVAYEYTYGWNGVTGDAADVGLVIKNNSSGEGTVWATNQFAVSETSQHTLSLWIKNRTSSGDVEYGVTYGTDPGLADAFTDTITVINGAALPYNSWSEIKISQNPEFLL